MNQDDKKVLAIFTDESREHLEHIEEDLLGIEQFGVDTEPGLIDKVFRAVHTIKGSAGFLGLTKIKELSHYMENVLGKIRAGILFPDTAIITPLLDSADTLKQMVESVGDSESFDISRLIETLDLVGTIGEKQSDLSWSEMPEKNSDSILVGIIQELGVSVTVDTAVAYDRQQASNGKLFYIITIRQHDLTMLHRSEETMIKEVGTLSQIITTVRQPVGTADSGIVLVIFCVASLAKSAMREFLGLSEQTVWLVFSGKILRSEQGLYTLCGKPIDSGTAGFRIEPVPISKNDNRTSSDYLPMMSDHKEHNGPTHQSEMGNRFNSDAPQTHNDQKSVPSTRQKAAYENTLRVAIGTLDRLMTLAGEMVLARNELLQNLSTRNLNQIQSVSQKVDSITSELQETIISTRMRSIGIVFNKFRRLVRDVAMTLGKRIVLDIRGEEVELDKSIVEAIGDPLTHLVRNSIDHGIETPEVRLRTGKQEVGTLLIKATHEAGHVLLEIADDGKGIDPVTVKNKARKLGFIDEETYAVLSDSEAIKLIFRPGFSTAEAITELSGRGVGMDVVQNNLKRVGGSIDIDSVVGKGTTIRIKLPLTLAIIGALLISVEDERYAIALSNIEELVRVPAVEVKNKIEMVGDASVLRLRGELLPLVQLTDLLNIQRTYIETASGIIRKNRRKALSDRRGLGSGNELPAGERRRNADRRKSFKSALNIVVVAAGDFKYGIVADNLIDSAEIVVKPLGCHLYNCREYAGATILGDGRVALILDTMGIRRLIEARSGQDFIRRKKDLEASGQLTNNNIQSFLLIENGEDEFFAIPVGMISRIDKINESMISMLDGKQIVHYHGATLRLLSIEDAAAVKKRRVGNIAYMIIILRDGREIGILVSNIIDTVSINVSDVDCSTSIQPCIMGTVYINNVFARIVDVFCIVRQCISDPDSRETVKEDPATCYSILVVEDSLFIRRQLTSLLNDAGYNVVCSIDGSGGLALLKNGTHTIDLVLIDFEMSGMDALEWVRTIHDDTRITGIPVCALISPSVQIDEQTRREAGISEYLIKFDGQSIRDACRKYIPCRQVLLQREESI